MRKKQENKNKKMKKAKTVSMILTIVMLVLLAGSIVHGNGMWPKITENQDGTITVLYENGKSIKISSGRFNAVKEILIGLENPEFVEGDDLKFSAINLNPESGIEKEYFAVITFDEKDQIQSQTYYETYISHEDNVESKIRIREINQIGISKVWIELSYTDETKPKDTISLDEEITKLPTGIPLKQIEKSNSVTSPDGKTELEIIGIEKSETTSEGSEETKIEKPKIYVPTELMDEIGNIFNSEKEGFSNVKWNSKDNKLTYTAKYGGVSTNVEIVWDKYNEIESKTYIKKLEDDITIKTVITPQTETTKTWENDIITYAKFRDQEIEKIGELGLSNVYYEFGVLKAVKDGDTSDLSIIKDENGISTYMFTYTPKEGENTLHTLQTLNGGGTLEFYNKNTEEGNLDGTITIIRGSEKIKFYGTFDGTVLKEENKKILSIDKDGNILTDFEDGEAQTTYYAFGSFNYYKGYVFGRKQTDGSEKIYFAGYVPFAFRIDKDNIIIIEKQKDGSYKYILNGNEVSEDNSKVKEAKAMVTKSLIGPAFEEAVRAARGGIALSNLLNSWLDIDFITNWRKKADEFFSETVIGRIISGKWEESVCHSKIEKIPDSIAVVNINNVIGFAAHVEGERSSAIKTNNQTLYFYKITFGVNPYGMGNVTFELLIDGNVVDLDNDGMADKIKLEADKTYSGTGENAIVRYKDKIYEEVCLKFYNTENLNLEFRNALKDDKLCNKIVEVDLGSVEISKPASSTAVSSTSTGQSGW